MIVRHGGRDVLELHAGPGPLVSVARRAPGTPPVLHPWVHGTSLDGAHEGELRQILDGAEGLADLVARLRAAGYEVVES